MKMRPINPNKILGRLQAGTLVREEWGDGRKRACLLAALAPKCAQEGDPSACPASVMPTWLAVLTPMMDDLGTDEAWEPMVRRYAAVAARWYKLDESGWRRAFLGSLVAILEVARPYAPSGSCDTVIALCHEGASAEDPRWEVAAKDAKVARAAARTAAMTAAANDPRWAAAAWETAVEAARTAADAVTEAVAWETAAEAEEILAEAEARAWDQMTDGILSAIEVECDRAEAP